MHMSGDASAWEVYGNVFCDTGAAPAGSTAHGVVANQQNGSIKRVKIYNNTIVGINGVSSGFRFFNRADEEVEAYNNLWYQCPATAHMPGVTRQDYETYIDTETRGELGPNDKRLKRVDPFVSARERDCHLARATDPGKKLEAPYDRDMFGNVRGADGAWDHGAMEFITASPAR